MSRRVPILHLAVMWTIALNVIPPAASAAEDLAPMVRRLVRELDAPELAQREEAEQRLVALGSAALEVLPRADNALPAGVQQELTRIRQQIERQAATTAGEASRVTLHARQRPLSQVLAAISQQTGNKLVDVRQQRGQPSADVPLTVDFNHVTFWEALDRTLDLAALEVDPYAGDDTLQIVARGEQLAPRVQRASYCGPFRIEATQIVAHRDLRNPANQVLKLGLEVSWEPRLRPIRIRQRGMDLAAVDEAGRPLTVANAGAVLEPTVQPGTAAVSLTLSLDLPPRSAREIAQLKGSLLLLVPGRAESFRFDHLTKAANSEKRIAGTVVTVQRVDRGDDFWAVNMNVRFDRPEEALESHRGWIFANEAYLEVPPGKVLFPRSRETTRQNDTEMGTRYVFPWKGALDDCQFVYKTPVLILSIRCPYELKGIALP